MILYRKICPVFDSNNDKNIQFFLIYYITTKFDYKFYDIIILFYYVSLINYVNVICKINDIDFSKDIQSRHFSSLNYIQRFNFLHQKKFEK